MRKFLLVFCASVACFLGAPRAAAQSQTTVTGNVVDPKGFFYAGGTVKPQLYPPGVAAPCVFVGPNCIPIPATVGPANIDFFGNFSVNVYPNALIFCNGAPCTTQWTFQICIAAPQAIIPQPIGTGDQCFSVTTTIAGASQNLTALITAAPPPNLTRIPIGSGSGCSPPGTDKGILTEHPVGSCFDSIDATWDDGVSKQNLQFGDGTNTNTGSQDSFMLASGGHTNLCFLCWNLGEANNINAVSLLNDEQKMVFGWFNSNSGAGSSLQLGDTNTMSFAGAAHCTGCNDDLIQIGTQNNMSSAVATVYEAPATGTQIGDVNQATISLAGGSITRFVQSGSANSFTETAGSNPGISLAYAYGLQNRVKDDLGSDTVFSGLYGFDNEADAIDPQDVSIFGASNTVHTLVVCTTGSCPPAQDTVVVGDQNTLTNVGSGLALSVHSTLSSCLACGVMGYNESNSVSNSFNIGMGSHEIEITPGLDSVSNLVDRGITTTPNTNPICPNGTGGQFTQAGCAVSIPIPVNWAANPSYGGNNSAFVTAANQIQIFAIAGPEVPVKVSAVSFTIDTSDGANNYSLGIYGPCALGATCSTLVCSTTAQTFGSVTTVSLPCSQGTVTINPVTTGGQYYFLASTGVAAIAHFASSNHILAPVCGASTTTSAGGALPASVVVPAASWTLCPASPFLLFHQ